MLADAGLSEKYWGFVANAAVYLKNRSPTSFLNGVTPYQARTGRRPSLKHLRPWGCLAFVHVPEEQRKKLGNRAQPGIFVGYCPTDKMYNVYDPIGRHLIRSRDIIFHEDRRYTASTTEEDIALMDHFKFRSDATAIDPFTEFGTPGPINKMYQNAMEILRKDNDLPSSPHIPLKSILTYIHRSDTPESALTDEDELLQRITQGHDESLHNDDFTEAPEEPQHFTVSSSAQPTTLKRDAKSLKSKLRSYWTTGTPDANTTRTTRSGRSAARDTGNLQDTLLLVVEDEGTVFANHPLFALAANIQPDHPDGITDPHSYNEATDSPYAEQWTEGMKAELATLEGHGVFGSGKVKLLELPVGRKALPRHWVFKAKRDDSGKVTRFKARLICGGNHHTEGINFSATYAPTARLAHIHLMLAIAAKYDFDLHQIDVMTAFLGGKLTEEIYMHPPQGFFCLQSIVKPNAVVRELSFAFIDLSMVFTRPPTSSTTFSNDTFSTSPSFHPKSTLVSSFSMTTKKTFTPRSSSG
jgi:hypothetical protein